MGNDSPVMIIQYLAIAILFFELLFSLWQKPSTLQSYMVVLTISTIVMFVGYNIELTATSMDVALAGVAFSYMGKPYMMLASFMVICFFYNQKIAKWALTLLMLFCSIFSILIFSNHYHHLYYATVEIDISRPYSPLIMTKGPLYYLYIATVIIYFIGCITVIVKNYHTIHSGTSRMLTIFLAAMVLCGIIGYTVYLSGITNGYDSTMLGVFGSVVCLFILFIRYHIFDGLAIAKDQALEDSENGLIVYNQWEDIVYKNAKIDEMNKNGVSTEFLGRYRDGNQIFTTHGLTYSIRCKEIYDNRKYLGRSIEVLDITDSANYQTRLENEIKERTEKLEDMQREIIASVANIVEARSIETGEHIKRTSKFVNIIANTLRDNGYYTDTLTEDYIRLLVSAAPLHDIGKISIPDSILLKPGRLTEEEFSVMKRHTSYGVEIIEQTMRGLETEEYVSMAEEVAKYHHEYYNGNGYPYHLKGEDIPLSARIVALADTFEALVSVRCYKQAYSKEKSIEIIKEESGTHFDPIIAQSFIQAIEGTDIATI